MARFSLFKKSKTANSEPQSLEEYRYCPRCDGEYRAEISFCAGCEVELVSKRRDQESVVPPREHRAIAPDEEVVAVQRGRLMDVKAQQRQFEQNGIASLIAGEGAESGGSCCRTTTFELQVRQSDAAAAQRLLEQEFRRSTGLDGQAPAEAAATVIDPSAARAYCPACSHQFSPEQGSCPECGLCF